MHPYPSGLRGESAKLVFAGSNPVGCFYLRPVRPVGSVTGLFLLTRMLLYDHARYGVFLIFALNLLKKFGL